MTETCKHRWVIASPDDTQGGAAPARCKLCGDERLFGTAEPLIDRYRLPARRAKLDKGKMRVSVQ